MSIRRSFSGAPTVKGNLRKFGAEWSKKSAKALLRIAGEVLKDSQENYVPVDKGDLQKNGRVVVSPKGRSVSIVFDLAYAVAVHEHLSEHSPMSWQIAEASGRGIHWTKPGTGPKYLEKPWLKMASEYLNELSQDLKV